MAKLLKILIIFTLLVSMSAKANSDEHMKEQTIELSFAVPDTTWSAHIEKVYQTAEQILVIGKLQQLDSNMMGLMVISQAKDVVKIKAPTLPVQFYVYGKTWGWDNQEDIQFIESPESLSLQLKNAAEIQFERVLPRTNRND